MATSKRFIALLDEIRELHERKNAGYSGIDSDDPFKNFKNSKLFGVSPFMGCLVRMADKFSRISNLSRNPSLDQVGESIKDTLLDLACYSLIAICLYEEDMKGENFERLI